MAQLIETPEGIAEFPDDMSQEQITAVLQKQFGAPPEPRSLSERVLRGLGLSGRYLAEKPALAVAGLSDLLSTGVNKGADLYSRGLTGRPLAGYVPGFSPTASQTVTEGFNRMGFPQAEGNLEKLGEDIAGGVVGLGFGIGAGQQLAGSARPMAARIGQVFSETPGLQAASIVGGETAGNVAEYAGAGPTGQMAARLGGAMVPSVAISAGAAGVRGAFRGGDAGRQQVASTIDDFSRVGTAPTVAQATQGRVARAAESGLSRAPGSAGVMTRTAEQQADDVAMAIEQKASQLAGKTSAVKAGRVIEEKIRGSFLAGFRSKQKQLYDNLDNWINPTTRVVVKNTSDTLDDMTRIIPGAEATSGRMVNQSLKNIADDFAKDAADEKLPFEALKQLRTRVGEKLSTVNLTDDVSKAEWKRLYGALSKDMEAAAAANPAAKAAFQRANSYTSAGHARLDAIENVIKRKGGPEKIFAAATSGTKEGATTLRSVMQSLDTEGQKVVSATVLRRMGLARPSGQNELGNLFSTETFLTNWNQLSKEAKRTLFDRYGKGFSNDMDAVARFAANLREGSKVFINPSGTAQATAQYTTAGAFAVSVLTGNVPVASAIAGGVVGTNRLAALMTNPDFVRWLAVSTKMPTAALPAQINLLAQQAAKNNDDDLSFAAALLQESHDQQAQSDQGRTQGQ